LNLRKLDKKRIGLSLGPIIFMIVMLVPEPQSMIDVAPAGNALAPQIALGMLLWILVWWVTECMPLGLAALIIPLVFCMSGILSWNTALSSFTNPIIWIFMAGFVLAAAFKKWELDRRVSVKLSSIYKGDNPMIAALFVACLPVFLLTMMGSITASTSVVFPFLMAYLAMLGVNSNSRYSTACMLAMAQAATAGAMLFLISTPPNLIAKNTISEIVPGFNLTFFDWLIVGTPFALIGLFISWVVVFKLIKPEMKSLCIDTERCKKAAKSLGRMTTGEKTVLAILFTAITLWMLPSIFRVFAEGNPGLSGANDLLSQIMPESMPAVLVILAIGLIRIKKEPVLRWNEIVDGIDWNVVFLFGGGIALGIGLEASGFANWIADAASASLGTGASDWMIFAVASIIGFALSYAASNTAAALIACPIAAEIALGAGLNPIGPIIGAGLACSISTALPSTTPPMAIVYSSGYVRIWDMFKVGIVSDLLRLVVLIALGPLLVGLIL